VGPQIDLLNMKTIMVPEEFRQQAQELIVDYLQATVPAHRPAHLRDRVRIVIECLLFGWFIPGRMPCRRAYNADCRCLSGSGVEFVGCANELYAPLSFAGEYECELCRCRKNRCITAKE